MAKCIVQWCGFNEGSDCGYCKGEDTSLSHGMWAYYLSCETYGELIDRGWRRSGKYCYKPMMHRTCCPQYTIRCDAMEIKLSKSQKKVLKRMNKFLLDGHRPNKIPNEECIADSKVRDKSVPKECLSLQPESIIDLNGVLMNGEEEVSGEKGGEVSVVLDSFTGNNVISSALREEKEVKGADPNKVKCRKAKEVRMERRKNKSSEKPVIDVKKVKGDVEKSLEDFINEKSAGNLHELETRLIPVGDKSFDDVYQLEYQLYCKYQHIVHGDSMDELTENQFKRFLVDGPLIPVPYDESDKLPSIGLGPFHHQYFLDGRLIAVGVLDILPRCLSSKYFFYDPDYSFLSLGTYSALREIHLVRSLNRKCPSFKYYYMGFYIANCPKMNYKAQYRPSYLLCPETYLWQPIEKCVPKFCDRKYSRLEEDETRTPPPLPDIKSTWIWKNSVVMTHRQYIRGLSSKLRNLEEKEIREYSSLVGSSCSNIFLYRS